MRWHLHSSIAGAVVLSVISVAAPLQAQGHGGGGMGMRGMGGMMGMGRDSATRAQMAVIHELVLNNERITRTVTNLPDGIRTVTESDDPLIAKLIRDHVETMKDRVVAGDDPGLPVESDALRALFRNKDKIRTHTDTTAKGIVIVQTSTDSATVAALQQHASEVTELVRGGMAAMHQAMMKNGGMRH
jgi:hypothetical protein